jgi:hypothetical protein
MAVDVADPYYCPPQSRGARIAWYNRARIVLYVLVFLGVWSRAGVVSDAAPRMECKAQELLADDGATGLTVDGSQTPLGADGAQECRIDIGGGVILEGTTPSVMALPPPQS